MNKKSLQNRSADKLKRGIIFTFCLFLVLPAQAKYLYKEKVYQEYWCTKNGGILEYKLPTQARVDCLLPNMAVEFDFAKKHSECLGQALEYGAYTKRRPVCVLILEREKDEKYLNRLRYTVQKKKLDVGIYTIKPSTLMKAGIYPADYQ